jgi:hypothetical protein
MSDETIPPALTAEQWERWTRGETIELARSRGARVTRHPATYSSYVHPHADMALANAALPDGDPRKITHGRVQLLRDYAAFFRREGLEHPRLAEMDAFADALAALLPPE